jgi:hypothetical protein
MRSREADSLALHQGQYFSIHVGVLIVPSGGIDGVPQAINGQSLAVDRRPPG